MAVTRNEFTLENGNKFYIRRYDAFLSLRVLGEVQKKFLVALNVTNGSARCYLK